jgi:hypothetical protein
VNPVKRQDQHDDEVGNQDRDVKGIPAVEVLKLAAARELRREVVGKALGGQKDRQRSMQVVEE